MIIEENVEIIDLTLDNIIDENIVCARSQLDGVHKKKEWLLQRFEEGLRFKLLKVDGRSWGMIEYLPAENGWRPIQAPGYMLINCFWVIGRYKHKGYGARLLEECFRDAKKMNGIAVLTSNRPMTPDKNYLIKKGFEICDSAFNIQLLSKRFKKAPLPKFNEKAKNGFIKNSHGITFIYSDQCPYITRHLNGLKEVAEFYGFPVKEIKLTSKEQAQNSPAPFDTFSIFLNGKFLMHGISKRKLAVRLSEITITG
jgi:GNAT superfamily N-acetyltransferase